MVLGAKIRRGGYNAGMDPRDDETVDLQPGRTADQAAAPLSAAAAGAEGAAPKKASSVVKPTTLGVAELLLLGMDSPSAGLGKAGKRGKDYAGETWTGRLIGDYRIEVELGRGGMGIVFRAINVRVGSTVALKLLRFAPGESAERLRRFENEARAAAALNHPHIINVIDVGQVGDLYYLAMEYIEGQSLSDKIAQRPMDPQQAVRITLDVCSALEFAHEAGVIHRDIKPSNILIEHTGRAQLMDFGLARSLGDADGGKKLTEAGSILGTVHYMSPEQALGQSHVADSRSDLYSLGAVMYEMATGRPPFDGQTPLEVVQKVAQDDPVRPRLLRSSLDRDLEIIILKAMEKDPARRYRSAAALGEDLWRYQAGEPIHARPASRLYRAGKLLQRHRAWTVPAGLALLVVVVVALGFLLHDRKLIRNFESESQAQQAELEDTLRQRLLELEAEDLLDPRKERWRYIHALRLNGQPQDALLELGLFPQASSPEQGLHFQELLWKGILKREAGRPEALDELSAAKKYALENRRLDLAALVEGYLSAAPLAAPAGGGGAERACFLYHQGHAALLREDRKWAAECYRRALAIPSRCLERACAAVELRRLEQEP